MARRTLARILSQVQHNARSAAMHRRHVVGSDPVSMACKEMAEECTERAVELLEQAVLMLRRSNGQQLTAWLAHPDAKVRQFAIEWMSVRD